MPRLPTGLNLNLGSMGWHTSDKIRAGVSCPKCKALEGKPCVGVIGRDGRGIVNHRERQVKYRRLLKTKMLMVAAR